MWDIALILRSKLWVSTPTFTLYTVHNTIEYEIPLGGWSAEECTYLLTEWHTQVSEGLH